MSKKHSRYAGPSGGAGAAVSESRTPLRDNLESIALAILMVLVVRQLVVEAFKIPTGSMAPTLLGVHKEVRCPNCGWTFRVGHDKVGTASEVQCPNCRYRWPGASAFYPGQYGGEDIHFRQPAWLWHQGRTAVSQETVGGMEAANRVNRWGSRIFVNKFIYKLRRPHRWEVVVFRYPYVQARCLDCGWEGELDADGPMVCPVDESRNLQLTRKNYIKRLVGLPGETLLLRNGDVYVSPEGKEGFGIARKPSAIQHRLWLPVFDSSYVPERLIRPRWQYVRQAGRWEEDRGTGALICDAAGGEKPLLVRFARPVRDVYAYNGNQSEVRRRAGMGDYHLMGDLRLRLDFSLPDRSTDPGAGLVLRLQEDAKEFVLFLPTGGGGEALLRDNGRVVARTRVGPVRSRKQRSVGLANYDDRVEARLDGEVVLSHEYTGEPDPDRSRQEVAFGARGVRVKFGRIRIDRDIYYIPRRGQAGGPARYELTGDSYMMLGDNSPASSDSRAWPDPRVPAKNLMGEAFGIFWPIHDINLLSIGSEPAREGNGQG